MIHKFLPSAKQHKAPHLYRMLRLANYPNTN